MITGNPETELVDISTITVNDFSPSYLSPRTLILEKNPQNVSLPVIRKSISTVHPSTHVCKPCTFSLDLYVFQPGGIDT